MAVRRTWKVERGDGTVDAYEDGRAPDGELLAELLPRWSRDLPVADWSDRALFAAICARRTNISPRDAAGMVGLTPEEITDVDIPDGPPWELTHPTDDATVRVVRREGAPNPGSW